MCSDHDYEHLMSSPEAVGSTTRPSDPSWYTIDLPVVHGHVWLATGTTVATPAQVARVPYPNEGAHVDELDLGIGGLEGRGDAIHFDEHTWPMDYGARWAQALRGGHKLFHALRVMTAEEHALFTTMGGVW